jgi:hypothetical protein
MRNEEKKKSDFLKTQSSIVWWKEVELWKTKKIENCSALGKMKRTNEEESEEVVLNF